MSNIDDTENEPNDAPTDTISPSDDRSLTAVAWSTFSTYQKGEIIDELKLKSIKIFQCFRISK